MKFKPLLGSDLSGSIAGITASHNTMGVYFRVRAMPTNPNSPAQQNVRLQMQSAHPIWNALPQETKDAWIAYALGTPISDKLGASIHIPGRLMFLRDFILRHVNGCSGPPIVVVTPGLTTLGYVNPAVVHPTTLNIAFDNGVDWATHAGGYLFVYASLGKGVGINFYKGPYAYAGKITGATPVPPTSPAALTLPHSVQPGQRVFIRAIATDEEGRLSEPTTGFCLSS